MGKKLIEMRLFSWWRRILLGLILMAMGLLTTLMLASYLVGRQLGAEIIKISTASQPLTFSDLEAHLGQSAADKQATGCYVEALLAINPDILENLKRLNTLYRKNLLFLPTNQFPAKLREKVVQNLDYFQPVLENFDKGAALPLSRFDICIEGGMQTCFVTLHRIQAAAFLLSLRTLELTLNGEDVAAANSVISLLKMTRMFDPHPIMLLHAAKTVLVGLTCEDVRLLLERGRLSEKSLAELQKALSETIGADALERMFQAERVYRIEMARNLIPENVVSRLLPAKAPDLQERVPLPSTFWGRLRLRHKSTQYFRDMAWLVAVAHRPWPQPLDAVADNMPKSSEKTSELLSSGDGFIRLTGDILAFVRCTILAVAVERYHRVAGGLPVSLDELLPAYIDSIPIDPFTGSQLLYHRDQNSFVVYSVGLNRKDDKGSVMPSADGAGSPDRGLNIRLIQDK